MEEKSDSFVVAIGIGLAIVILLVVGFFFFQGHSEVRQVGVQVAPPSAQQATDASAADSIAPAKIDSSAPDQPAAGK